MTDTDATGTGRGALTVRADAADFPWLVARIIAVPGATAATSPMEETVATLALVLSQVTVSPTTGAP